MAGQEKIIISLQGQYGQVEGIPEDNIADTAMAKCLNIMNNAVHLPSLYLSLYIPKTLVD